MSYQETAPNQEKRQVVIGVCGPSTSGKSTLIYNIEKYLSDSYNFDDIAMEDFFKRTGAPKINLYGKPFTNLDVKEAIKWDDFYQSIAESEAPILFLDGFMLFADQRSYGCVDACITIEYNTGADYDIALDRRINRYRRKKLEIDPNYLENPHKNNVNSHCTYFHDVVWAEMLQHPEYIRPRNWQKPLLTLSATDDMKENTQMAIDFLKPLIDHLL